MRTSGRSQLKSGLYCPRVLIATGTPERGLMDRPKPLSDSHRLFPHATPNLAVNADVLAAGFRLPMACRLPRRQTSQVPLLMPIPGIWATTPDQLEDKQIHRLIAFSGRGKLLDNSQFRSKFRAFLATVPSMTLKLYSVQCLKQSFQDSGITLRLRPILPIRSGIDWPAPARANGRSRHRERRRRSGAASTS